MNLKIDDFYIIAWFDKNTVKHLRFPFSFFLMPVFLFALSQAGTIHWENTIMAFFIFHLLIFPSSNGYNSFQDRDETSIGGIKYPPKITNNLFYATMLMDILGLICSFFISFDFFFLIFTLILLSRAYSYRGIRLKKYAIGGFLTVFIFQGAFVYLSSLAAISNIPINGLISLNHLVCMGISSLFIGSMYPLTQIYQHEADRKDGVTSISYKLGYSGTFIFSAIQFIIATALLIYHFSAREQMIALLIFLLLMLPAIYQLTTWFNKVKQNISHANYENTMAMNVITSTSMNIFFTILVINNFLSLF